MMESDIEIFDKAGKSLKITDVIARYLFEQAKQKDKDVRDLILGIDYTIPLGDGSY